MRSIRPAILALLLAVGALGGAGAARPVASTQASQPPPYRILVVNDDGVRAAGLAAVAQILQAIGDVTIVAPSENQSGTSQSVNTRQPIFREDLTLPNGLHAIGLTATPATTVQVAIKNIMTPRPDLVVSGINNGYNLGTSTYLAGTVGAARQAVMEGVPAIAASMAAAAVPRDIGAAAEEVLGVARRVKQYGLAARAILNVNIPPLPAGGYKGYRVTTQAYQRGGTETFAETRHPGTGTTIYWSVYQEGGNAPEGTDIWAVQNGYVSVTPLRVGETDAAAIDAIAAWFR
jgi:5'-nucleotidase